MSTPTDSARVLLMRTCGPNGEAHKGFIWPLEVGAIVRPQKWDPDPKRDCGDALHALLWGVGGGNLLNWCSDAVWLVVSALPQDVLPAFAGKNRVREVRVEFIGKCASECCEFMRANGAPADAVMVGSTLTGGDGSTLTGGDRSTLTGGYGSTLRGGDHSTLTGGYGSTLTGGYGSTLTGGDRSTLTGGYDSTLTGGYGSTLTGGYGSTLTGGDRSTLTGGNDSTLTGGNRSTLTGGNGSTLTGGYGSTLTGGYGSTLTGRDRSTLTGRYGSTLTGGCRSTLTGGYGSTLRGGDGSTLTGGNGGASVFTWYNPKKYRYELRAFNVGDGGLKPDVAYRLNEQGEPEEVNRG